MKRSGIRGCHHINAVDIGSEALASQELGEAKASLPKNNAQAVLALRHYILPYYAKLHTGYMLYKYLRS